jgi:hypothetical protein
MTVAHAGMAPDVESIPVDPPPPEREPRARIWPRVLGVLILLLGVGGAWLWQNPGSVQTTFGAWFPGLAGHETGADPVQTLDARLTRLEQRPLPADPSPELVRLTQRLDALEKRVSQPPAAVQPDTRALSSRLDSLEAGLKEAASAPRSDGSRPPAQDLSLVLARLNALEKNVAAHDLDAAKVDAIAARVETLSTREPSPELRARLDGVEQKMSGLSATDAKLAEGSDRALRLARLEAASVALSAGRPLGAIADAPPALAKYATAAPPTEAALRLDFAQASREALKVSKPDTEGKPFVDRVLARLQDFRLITVREGDQVVIGNAAAATLARAHVLLEAGDLGGATKTVATLTGPPAEKMAPWLADAMAVQAAREAVASLAAAG